MMLGMMKVWSMVWSFVFDVFLLEMSWMVVDDARVEQNFANI
jgi:hypothetical protein